MNLRIILRETKQEMEIYFRLSYTPKVLRKIAACGGGGGGGIGGQKCALNTFANSTLASQGPETALHQTQSENLVSLFGSFW